MSARKGPREHIATTDFLFAVGSLGRTWPAAFARSEVTAVNEALDREILAGTVDGATGLSPRGVETLKTLAPDRVLRDMRAARVEGCRAHEHCWQLTCAGCAAVVGPHLLADDVADAVFGDGGSHACAQV